VRRVGFVVALALALGAAGCAGPRHAPGTTAGTTGAPSTAASTVAPSTVEPSTLEPSTAAPSTAAPSTVEPSTVAPSTVTSVAAPSPVTLLAVGDSGTGDAAERAVTAAMAAYATDHPVTAVVALGDNVYPDGSPGRFGAALDRPFAGLRGAVPLWATLGNHDVQAGHGGAQLAHLGLPPLPYARVIPGVAVYLLDADHPDEAQAEWLDEQLSAPGPAVRIVAFHQPPYSCGPHGDAAAVVDRWVPVLERHRVTLVLSGHDHLYERFTSPAGTTYVVSGGGGAGLYALGRCSGTPPLEAGRSARHFLVLDVVGTSVHLRALTPEGEVLDDAVVPA
jgi:hypothetical protein